MKRDALGAVGALLFGLLTFAAMLIAGPPGGSYSAKDAANFVAHGHHTAVFVSIYLFIAASVGLVLLLVRLRAAIQNTARASVFWALGIAATSAWVVGYTLAAALPIAMTYGGRTITASPVLTYTLAEIGWVVAFGAGGILLGCTLLTFAAGPVAVPAWVRWATAVGGLGALAGPAWFPFFLVYIWAVVLGVWLASSGRTRTAPVPATAG